MNAYILSLMPAISSDVERYLEENENRINRKVFERNLFIYRSCIHDHTTARSMARRYKLSVRTVEEILSRFAKVIKTIEQKIANETAA